MKQNGKVFVIFSIATMSLMLSSCHKESEPTETSEQIEEKGFWLSLSQNKTGPRYLVDSTGSPFPLFGMARCQIHAPSEDATFGGIDGLCKYFKSKGCNSIRLAVSSFNELDRNLDLIEQCGGYNETGINKFIDKYVNPDVQAIIRNEMYIVLDLHEYPPAIPEGDPDPGLVIKYAREHYIPIWIELAKRYKDEPLVAVYEIWNEPYPADQGSLKIGIDGKISQGTYLGYDWNANVRQFYMDCVEELRKIDTRHLIMVSDYNAGWGTAWATTWKDYKHMLDPLYDKIIYSIHASRQHTDNENGDGLYYASYWANSASNNNICRMFGELETEQHLATEQSMGDFIGMLDKYKDSHHYSVFLWRPHKSENNNYDYVSVWSEFALNYVVRL